MADHVAALTTEQQVHPLGIPLGAGQTEREQNLRFIFHRHAVFDSHTPPGTDKLLPDLERCEVGDNNS